MVQHVLKAVHKRLIGRGNDVLGHAHGVPRIRAVARLNQHARLRHGTSPAVENTDFIILEIQILKLGISVLQGLSKRLVQGIHRPFTLRGRVLALTVRQEKLDIIGRCSEFLTKDVRSKISSFCDVEPEAVITGLDVDDVYEIPIIFEKEGLVGILHRKLNIYSPPDLTRWKQLIGNRKNPKKEITVAMCGKYTKLEDSYASIIESFNHCSANLSCKINLRWVETTDLGDMSILNGVDGIVVPGGFGSRGTEGKIEIIHQARRQNIPFLGLCLGLHMAVIEFARHVCNLDKANSTEMDADTPHPVIDILPEQKDIEDKGGTMRLGAYPAILKPGSVLQSLYDVDEVSERHRHRYEVNPEYHEEIEKKGMVFSGCSPDGRLVEFIELPDLKFFVATQAHPELKSRMEKPAPLFYGFVKACLD